LVPRLVPGFYISVLGVVSLICSCFIKHPHDVRIAGPKLRAAVEEDKKKFKAAMKAKKKRRKDVTEKLNTTTGKYFTRKNLAVDLSNIQHPFSTNFRSLDLSGEYFPPIV
jgi:hypothetical protein